jgi:outer membrane protein OmpA-like peptidoglycan-associated protein
MFYFKKWIFPLILVSLISGCATEHKKHMLTLAFMEELETIAETKRTDEGVIVTLKEKILFDFNKFELKSEAIPVLIKLAKILEKSPNTNMTIEGYTDNIGTTRANILISKKRAETVERFLINNGVASKRIKTNGLGQINPVSANSTPEGRAKNRRVELHIFPTE